MLQPRGADMDDMYVRRQWAKEEDFLADHYETVDALLARIGNRWRPNYRCTEAERQRRAMLLARGQLAELVFDGAAMFYGRDGLSSIRVYLRSSTRLVV